MFLLIGINEEREELTIVILYLLIKLLCSTVLCSLGDKRAESAGTIFSS